VRHLTDRYGPDDFEGPRTVELRYRLHAPRLAAIARVLSRGATPRCRRCSGRAGRGAVALGAVWRGTGFVDGGQDEAQAALKRLEAPLASRLHATLGA
jgi:hypothetical protein